MSIRAGSNRIADLESADRLDDKDEFLFFQNSTKKTKKVTKRNMLDTGGGLRGKFVDSATGNNIYYIADLALTNAALAQATANGAQTSADGKAKVYYQTTEPTGGTYNAGDLWYDTDDNYKLYVRSGSSWVASFAPMIKLGANNNISGLIKADGTDKDFVLIADKFQIWNGVSAEVPFEIVGGNVYIKNAQIQTVDAGKLTAGFISSEVIELSDSGAYIQSSIFIETWVTGKLYKTTRTVPSDQTKVKVLQNDGTYLVYNCAVQHTSGATFAADLAASKWTLASPQPSVQGFRIIGSGEAEFQDVIIRGTVYATTGYFGNTSSVVSVDAGGLVVGSSGVIKSSGTTWTNSGGTGTFGGSSGFYLGYTPGPDVYQFFIGNPSANNLRWDGSTLKYSGNLVSGTTIGSSGDGSSSYGLILNSNYGIRHSAAGNAGIITITAGSSNGATNGAQLELHGNGSTGNQGLVTLQAGTGTVSAIRLFTNLGTSGTTGTLRFDIDTYGTVGIPRTFSSGNVYTDDGVSGGAGCMEIDGNVGIGRVSERTTIGQGKLWVANEVAVYGAGNTRNIVLTGSTGDVTAVQFTTSSSRKLKINIKKLNSGISTIENLNPVSYKRKGAKDKKEIGLIAEEVNEIIPDIVKKDANNNPEGIDYSKLTVILINAVKELSAEVKELKKKIK